MFRHANAAQQRYFQRTALCMSYYALVLALTLWTLRLGRPNLALACALAALSAAGILALMASLGAYLREERDEFQVSMAVKALLGGLGATLAAVSFLGVFEDILGLRRTDLALVFPLFWLLTALSYGLVRLRYR